MHAGLPIAALPELGSFSSPPLQCCCAYHFPSIRPYSQKHRQFAWVHIRHKPAKALRLPVLISALAAADPFRLGLEVAKVKFCIAILTSRRHAVIPVKSLVIVNKKWGCLMTQHRIVCPNAAAVNAPFD